VHRVIAGQPPPTLSAPPPTAPPAGPEAVTPS
jgi:hypothetical protein